MDNNSDIYRDRLKKVISKKIETTMIYPLSEFEREFGHLWGQGKDYNELTDEELDYRDKWEKCRTNVLDIGNKQKRNANTEINQYNVDRRKYTAIFIPIDRFNNRGNSNE